MIEVYKLCPMRGRQHYMELTGEQIEFVLQDRYFVRNVDDIDVYGRIRKD